MSRTLREKLNLIKQSIDQLESRYYVKRIGIFGSNVNGRPNKKSDVDILVEFSQPVGFFKFIELEEELGQLLQAKVDLATPKALKPIIKQQILKDVVYVK